MTPSGQKVSVLNIVLAYKVILSNFYFGISYTAYPVMGGGGWLSRIMRTVQGNN